MMTTHVDRLRIILPLACILAIAGCNDSPTDAGNAKYGDIEQAVHEKINDFRISKGLPALTFNATIAAQARAHSADMAAGRLALGHDGFSDRIAAIARTIAVSSSAENVAFNVGFADPASEAVAGWLASPGHLANIEGDFELTGIGVDKSSTGEYYFTQIFVKR